MSSIVAIEKAGSRIVKGRELLKQELSNKPDGILYVMIKEKSGYGLSWRYKYYRDCVLDFCLEAAKTRYGYIENGKFRPIRNTDELHEHMKKKYNQVTAIDAETGDTFSYGASTTELNDRDFFDFVECVMMEFSLEPYFIEFPTYEEYKEMHKKGEWSKYKLMATADLEI